LKQDISAQHDTIAHGDGNVGVAMSVARRLLLR
jgi:hypothetical protein